MMVGRKFTLIFNVTPFEENRCTFTWFGKYIRLYVKYMYTATF